MRTLEKKDKTYFLNDHGFLVDPAQWDEDFAREMALPLGMSQGLTPSHWEVLKFIRATYMETGSCPTVHKTCKVQKLNIKDLQALFPSGYQRGACKLAGIPFVADDVCIPYSPPMKEVKTVFIPIEKRVYRVNVQGFLIDPNEWDEDFAEFKARELQMSEPLRDTQLRVVRYLRSEYEKRGNVPLVYETCNAMGIDIDELVELFPSGYHRGAVKIAGLNLASHRQTLDSKYDSMNVRVVNMGPSSHATNLF